MNTIQKTCVHFVKLQKRFDAIRDAKFEVWTTHRPAHSGSCTDLVSRSGTQKEG